MTTDERADLADAVIDAVDAALGPIRARLADVVGRIEEQRDRFRDADQIRERVAALEARPPVPGPPGASGADGAPGRDGLDGIGFEDLDVAIDGRTLTFRFVGVGRDRAFSVDLPVPWYRGVYVDGRTYSAGDVVTSGGSAWICLADTTIARPVDGGSAWQLMVKRGADGKGRR